MTSMKGWAGVARLGGIGDNLVAASVCRGLKKQGYNVEMITGKGNHVVFFHNPHIDKLSVKEDGDIPGGGGMDDWQNWFRTRAKEFDKFAHLSHSMEGQHALFKSMTAFWWPPEFRRKICAGSYLETAHDIAGIPYEFGPLYFTSEDEHARAIATKSRVGERCIGWIMSGSRLDKVWPYAPTLIARIIKEMGVPVLMFGAPNERQANMCQAVQEVVKMQNSSLKDLHACIITQQADQGGNFDWPIRRSMAQLMHCDLIVTPDTGGAWAVAFEPMPKVLLVSHASADNIGKHWTNTTILHANPERVPCWPCHRLHDGPETCNVSEDGNAAKCMADIDVETVFSAIKEKWKHIKANPSRARAKKRNVTHETASASRHMEQ